MSILASRIKVAGVLVAIAACLALPQRSSAQSKLHRVLDRQIDTKPLQETMKIKEALQLIQDRQQTGGGQLPIFVDTEAFRSENLEAYPTEDQFWDTAVRFPPFPSTMTVGAALRLILDKVPTKNATFVVFPEHILITTYAMTSPERKLVEKVRGVFDKLPLNAVLRDLSDTVGVTIVIDNRAAEKAKAPVSAVFLNDTDLGGALRVLTEMAELKVVVLDGAIFVTTPQHVESLRKEYSERGKGTKAMVPVGSGGLGGLGGSPGMPGFPPGFEPEPVDPFWPYSPRSRSGGPAVAPTSMLGGFGGGLFQGGLGGLGVRYLP